MQGMDRYTRASFDACLTENILSSLSRTVSTQQLFKKMVYIEQVEQE